MTTQHLLPLKRFFLCTINLLCSLFITQAHSQDTYRLDFADIEITFTKGVQRQLESIVAAYPTQTFLDNLPQVEAYLDLVAKELNSERIPTDYQYACLYKLYLQSIDTDKAGFWNLEKDKAINLGLKVNASIDERFNLISSTYEMMREIRRNNIYFKNWLINLIPLETTFDEAKEYVRGKYFRNDLVGARKWLVNEETHPFIREVLAFKWFMQQKIEPWFTQKIELVVELNMNYKSLRQIAREKDISVAELQYYNIWLKKNKIPGDKIYPILIPQPKTASTPEPYFAQTSTELLSNVENADRIPDDEYVSLVDYSPNETPSENYSWKKNQEELRATILQQEEELAKMQQNTLEIPSYPLPSVPEVAQAQTHVVIKGQTLYGIAKIYGTTVQALRTYNGLEATSNHIYPDQVLYLQPRPSHTPNQPIPTQGQLIHFVKAGENLQSIAKAYQTTPEQIRNWNQLPETQFLEIGQKLIIHTHTQQNRVFKTQLRTATPLLTQAPYQSQSLTQKLAKYTQAPKMMMRGQSELRASSHLRKPQLMWLPTLSK